MPNYFSARMSASKQPGKRRGGNRGSGGHHAPRRPSLGLKKTDSGTESELVHPRCARERAEDLAEVEQMLDAGETEIARDELRWLLDGCDACLACHRLLGEIALEDGDYQLARGHFGYAYELGRAACRPAGAAVRLPYARPANKSLLESAKGLAFALLQLGRLRTARDVLLQLLDWDPSDPLGGKRLLDEIEHSPNSTAEIDEVDD